VRDGGGGGEGGGRCERKKMTKEERRGSEGEAYVGRRRRRTERRIERRIERRSERRSGRRRRSFRLVSREENCCCGQDTKGCGGENACGRHLFFIFLNWSLFFFF